MSIATPGLTTGEGNLPRFCACGCGQELRNRHPRAKYWSDACRYRARIPQRPFVALDGEGETRPDGLHIYTLLAGDGKDIRSKQGLSTEECLDFLLGLPRGQSGGRKPIYVWFAFDYDVNMILADIPLKGENSIETLRETNTVIWRGYRITYLRRKILRIARGTKRHTSYDIWGFFQSSFESACDSWNVKLPRIISEGKASRSGFSRWTLQRIADYNKAELVALEELAEKLRDSVTPLDLPIQSWHGPAALAGAWLQKHKVKEWKSDVTDPELLDVFARAYFGGRIDVLGYGKVNPVYHYDIISAYPAAIANLPKLTDIVWRQGKKVPDCGRLYLARIEWNIQSAEYWYPFPWRANNGSIRYPPRGEGWYWNSEIESAQKKYPNSSFKIKEVIWADGEYEFPFRQLIRDTFAYRNELKQSAHPSHIPVKLVLNSLYGKFAQTVGKARYYSPIWAGMITSQTRAKLLDAITDETVCVMTDSIWSREPLDISLGKELGDWEQGEENELILAEAGLYQAISPDGSTHVWQRGFDKRNPVDISVLVEKWLNDDPGYSPIYEVSRFIGMGLASVTSYPWRHWLKLERKIEPVPFCGTTKRMPFLPDGMGVRTGDFVKLQPRPRDSETLSAPYKKLTESMQLIQERLEEECEE